MATLSDFPCRNRRTAVSLTCIGADSVGRLPDIGCGEGDGVVQALKRITLDPAVMGGKACIRGLRITVRSVLGPLAAGRARDEILRAYPCLEGEDIDEALAYAAWRVAEREVPLVRS